MVESGAGTPAEWFCEQQPERHIAVGFAGGLPLAGRSIGCALRSTSWTRLPVLAKELYPPFGVVTGSNSGGTTKALQLLVPTVGWEAFLLAFFRR